MSSLVWYTHRSVVLGSDKAVQRVIVSITLYTVDSNLSLSLSPSGCVCEDDCAERWYWLKLLRFTFFLHVLHSLSHSLALSLFLVWANTLSPSLSFFVSVSAVCVSGPLCFCWCLLFSRTEHPLTSAWHADITGCKMSLLSLVVLVMFMMFYFYQIHRWISDQAFWAQEQEPTTTWTRALEWSDSVLHSALITSQLVLVDSLPVLSLGHFLCSILFIFSLHNTDTVV